MDYYEILLWTYHYSIIIFFKKKNVNLVEQNFKIKSRIIDSNCFHFVDMLDTKMKITVLTFFFLLYLTCRPLEICFSSLVMLNKIKLDIFYFRLLCPRNFTTVILIVTIILGFIHIINRYRMLVGILTMHLIYEMAMKRK